MRNAIITLFTGLLLACSVSAQSQSRSIGMSYSFSGIGVTYGQSVDNNCFYDISLTAQLGEVFMNRTDCPGLSAAFTCNYIFHQWASSNGNIISMYAGPGMDVGFARDFRKEWGYLIGLKGRLGGMCVFDRNIAVSFSLSPTVGCHMTVADDNVRMEYFRYGLLGFIIPEVGIRFCF
jgi:hypothetical protein